MPHRYFVADVFTDTPLEGNQVAVFTEAADIRESLMQATAREMKLAETVFVLPAERDGDVKVRIFTPGVELPFAGHPILGTAFVIGGLDDKLDTVRIETGAGTIPVTLERDSGRILFGRMDQPIPSPEPFADADRLLEALHVERSGLPIERYRNGPEHVYVELESEDAVKALRPDLEVLASWGPTGISCFAGSGVKWKTRMFGPGVGVPEDAATCSAAGPLALHLARHGRIGFGTEIEIRQGAEIGRPSVLHAAAYGTADKVERVVVGGAAVVVAEGWYRLD